MVRRSPEGQQPLRLSRLCDLLHGHGEVRPFRRWLLRRGQAALAEEYRQLWEIVCGGLEQCAQLLGGTPMELEEFAALFRLVLSQYDVGTIPVSLDRVTAGETTRQIGQHGKVLFLLGADDASIPQVSTPAGLLSDDDRSLLASYGLELNQTARDLLYREMTTVYLTCARPTRKLIVSWPGQSGAGGGLSLPAQLVEAAAHLGQEGELAPPGGEAEQNPLQQRLCSVQQLKIALGSGEVIPLAEFSLQVTVPLPSVTIQWPRQCRQ